MRLFLCFLFCFSQSILAQAPALPLSAQQIDADFNNFISIVDSEYSGTSLKNKFHPKTWEQIKKQYADEILKVKKSDSSIRNEMFTKLMTRLVAEFKDGHFRMGISPSELPGLSKLHTLGVIGKRYGDDFVVTNRHFLANNETELKVGDVITHIEYNGEFITVRRYFDQVIRPYINLGNNESTYSYAINMIFNRSSLIAPDPNVIDGKIKFRVKRPVKFLNHYFTKTQEVSSRWISEDYAKMKLKRKKLRGKTVFESNGKTLYLKDHLGNDLDPDLMTSNLKPSEYAYTDLSFKRFDWSLLSETPADETSTVLKKTFNPLKKFFQSLKKRHVYPSSILEIQSPKGQEVAEQVGYIKINTFYPDIMRGNERKIGELQERILNEVSETLDDFHAKGIRKIILDTTDNPGGLVSLTVRLAQMFSPKPLEMLQFKFPLTSDEWLQTFGYIGQAVGERNSSNGPLANAYMEFVERFFKDNAAGKVLSEPVPMDILFNPERNQKLMKGHKHAADFNITVLQSGLNASGGDVFPALMKMNNLAYIIGSQTIGAGGTVKSFAPLAHSRVNFNLTSSLIYYPKKYGEMVLENNGVRPHFDLGESKMSLYRMDNMQGLIKQTAYWMHLKDVSRSEWIKMIKNKNLNPQCDFRLLAR